MRARGGYCDRSLSGMACEAHDIKIVLCVLSTFTLGLSACNVLHVMEASANLHIISKEKGTYFLQDMS